MDSQRINEIGLNANIAILRAQIDALLSVLNEDKRTQYQTNLFTAVQNILDNPKIKGLYTKEEFDFFKGCLEDGVVRNEL